MTFGVAELIDRALFYITDSVDGTITNKEETIQETIDRLNDDIGDLEIRIERKMAELERRFIAMETALSQLQSQSDWLSGQINAVNRSWT